MTPLFAVATLAGALILAGGTTAAQPAAERGRAAWLAGPEGATARIGGLRPVPASRFPCAGCHGRDAAGGGEGATQVPDVSGRALGARGYGRAGFLDALATGIAPDGRRLDPAMPRYALSPEQGGAIWAFLSRVEVERRAGISATEIIFVCLVDPASPTAVARARAVHESWRQAFAQRRIFGRMARLVFSDAPDPARLSADAFAFLCLDGERALALENGSAPVLIFDDLSDPGPAIASFLPGPDDIPAALARIARALEASGRQITREAFLANLNAR